MLNPNRLMENAQNSSFHLWVLNQAMAQMVPFNKPHGFKIKELSKYHVKTFIPYKRRNLNHIKGLHATALATLSEFTTGVLLLNILGARNYRIILQRLDIEYHYQGKMSAEAYFEVDDSWLKQNVYLPLQQHGQVIVPCEIHIHDTNGNKLTSARIYWQLKPWKQVKTMV